ncbi:MAG: DegT/DnrJ/EryC1/StrS family aminotransferase [Clostridia bacterium]|nr:DegT/DnrJ/EryC1/StrS family aminotransferase [Clostridia bacterium]
MFRIGKEEIDAVTRVIESRKLFKINDGNQEVFNFENELREKFDVENALLMTSGKAALISALTGMGIGPGDEVIVPGYTYIATAIAVTATGAIPVIAEIDETLAIDPIDVEKKITPRTKAIIPVHMQGMPCNMDALMEISKKYGVKILEDACQADGGSYKGKRLGTIGDAGALSFNYFKIITAGEGGALLTNDKQIYQRAYIYHDSSAVAFFGNQLDGNEEEQFCGTEYRVGEITAAILREQLKRLDGILADLRRIKSTLKDALKDDFEFVPSNDEKGDCSLVLALKFDSEEKARAFKTKFGSGELPIDTGKHVYSNWTAIMKKRGAFNPLIDPFKMEANKDMVPDYTEDMCPKTLDILSRTVYIYLNPDRTDAEIQEIIEKCKNAKP